MFNQSSLSAEALAEDLGGVDDSIVNYAKNCKNGTATTEGFKKSLQGMTLGAKLGQVALKGLAIAGNMIAMWAISEAISFFVEKVDESIVTLEEQREELESLKSEYSELESEIESLNDELQTTSQRMTELEKMDSLTFAEKEEYDNLVATNNELERKIELLELEKKIKDREKQEAFIQAMEKDANEGNEYWQDGETGRIAKGDAMWAQIGGMLAFDATEKEYILQQFETRQNLEEELLKAIEDGNLELVDSIENQIGEIDSYLISKSSEWDTMSEGISYISNPTTEDEKAVNAWLDYIADFQSRMAIAIGGDSAKTNAFNRLVDNWQFDDTVQELQDLGAEGKVTAEMLDNPKYDDFINKLVEIGVINSADDLDLIALAFNGVAFKAENAKDAVDDFNNEITALTVSDTIDALNSQLKPAFDDLLNLSIELTHLIIKLFPIFYASILYFPIPSCPRTCPYKY